MVCWLFDSAEQLYPHVLHLAGDFIKPETYAKQKKALHVWASIPIIMVFVKHSHLPVNYFFALNLRQRKKSITAYLSPHNNLQTNRLDRKLTCQPLHLPSCFAKKLTVEKIATINIESAVASTFIITLMCLHRICSTNIQSV